MAENLEKLVNASGFAFQLAVEHAVRTQSARHQWRVVSREHPWVLGQSQGFIDLVLDSGMATAVVECKRTKGGAWVFLVEDEPKYRDRSGTRVHWIAGNASGQVATGINVVAMTPDSYISSFCAVRGSGENDRPFRNDSGFSIRFESCSRSQEENSKFAWGFWV